MTGRPGRQGAASGSTSSRSRTLPPPEGAAARAARPGRSDPAGGETAGSSSLDLGGRRELGGLALDWDAARLRRGVYDVEMSDDGKTWSPRAIGRGGRGAAARGSRCPSPRPRFVRLRLATSARGPRLRARASSRVEPPEFAETPTQFLEAVAARRAARPLAALARRRADLLDGRRRRRRQARRALLSEDGALEIGARRLRGRAVPRRRTGSSSGGPSRGHVAVARRRRPAAPVGPARTTRTGSRSTVTAFADGPPDASTMRVAVPRRATPARRAVRATLLPRAPGRSRSTRRGSS